MVFISIIVFGVSFSKRPPRDDNSYAQEISYCPTLSLLCVFYLNNPCFPLDILLWASSGCGAQVGPTIGAAAWQDSKRTLWGLKVPKASWVISHYGAVTEGSAVNTEIIWAMVNDSAVQAFGMIKDRSSCTRHLSGP